MLPPGLTESSLTNTRAGTPSANRWSATRGVRPMNSRMFAESADAGSAEPPLAELSNPSSVAGIGCAIPASRIPDRLGKNGTDAVRSHVFRHYGRATKSDQPDVREYRFPAG